MIIFSHLQMTFAIRLRIHSEAGHGFGVKLTRMNIVVPLKSSVQLRTYVCVTLKEWCVTLSVFSLFREFCRSVTHPTNFKVNLYYLYI
jgi:hypothetical protein